MIQPLDWPQLVAEALRRRKAEGLTQQAHADLAGVSKPVIIAFDKGETTLSLGRALSILKVVGLLLEGPAPGSHAAFVAAARARWQDLIAPLPADDPARHPLGGCEVDYRVADGTRTLNARDLLGALRGIVPVVDMRRLQLRWRPFWVPTREDLRPYIADDGMIECWLGRPDALDRTADPADTDFWRLSAAGSAYLRRAFEEDGPSVRNPGTFFDATQPIQWAILVLLHAANLAELLAGHSAPITIQARYRGLARRELTSFSDPGLRERIGAPRSQADSADLRIQTDAVGIRADLPAAVGAFLSPLYERFDGYRLHPDEVGREVKSLTRGHNSSNSP